ncbi:MAG: hypothetical protein Q4A72_05475 [Bacillota bacterium]|nr:hypothetical protein [Bacillota bacterium]
MFIAGQEAELLASTYFDEMSVYRPVKVVENGESKFLKGIDGEKVLEKVPCSLSQKNGGNLEKDIAFNKAKRDYIVFTRPEVIVKENDLIVLTVNLGTRKEIYHLTAGKAMLYPSHQEIPAVEEIKA